jgi:hypothetical protein
MSKVPKNNNNEKPTKINMSFEDLIRKAMKTKPSLTISLKVDEKTEVPKVAGHTVIITAIETSNNIVSNYSIEFEILSFRGKGKIIDHIVFGANLTEYDLNQSVREITKNNRFIIEEGTELHLTLRWNKKEPMVKIAKITYSVV